MASGLDYLDDLCLVLGVITNEPNSLVIFHYFVAGLLLLFKYFVLFDQGIDVVEDFFLSTLRADC